MLIENPMSYDVPLLIEFDGDGPQDVSTDIVLIRTKHIRKCYFSSNWTFILLVRIG